MGKMKRRQILIGLGFVMLLGIAVYLRLWTIDYRISSNDTELLRKQFDLANREAMDESAEWRRRFDHEFDKASKCLSELDEYMMKAANQSFAQMKKSLHGRTKQTIVNRNMEMLQKENIDLLERVESLKKELEAEKLRCSTPKI
ncbi:basic-leucine zipper transcription factor family protein [Striga asiatica]|uniref:Basic-leucine zipper transcription factor family protein n=1 Tax=Striga asiatica TaxID=4170 RepID=A0A5A7QK96_STRAF|nr:basic-leucine zipper transcription factor family protein [Striga asiatica]